MVRLNRNKKDEDYSIEITPLVDVVFLLLIFFLLTASYIQPTLDLSLPEAETSRPQDHTNPCTIAIATDGTIRIDEVPATLEDIRQIPIGKEVLIVEDREGPYGVFIAVLDTLRLTGIFKISIVTDEKTE